MELTRDNKLEKEIKKLFKEKLIVYDIKDIKVFRFLWPTKEEAKPYRFIYEQYDELESLNKGDEVYLLKINAAGGIYTFDEMYNKVEFIITDKNNETLYKEAVNYKRIIRKHLTKNLGLPPYSTTINIYKASENSFFCYLPCFLIKFRREKGYILGYKDDIIDNINEHFNERYTNYKKSLGQKDILDNS